MSSKSEKSGVHEARSQKVSTDSPIHGSNARLIVFIGVVCLSDATSVNETAQIRVFSSLSKKWF